MVIALMRIARTALQSRIQITLERAPIVVLFGPRQAGKTSLAREFSRCRCRHEMKEREPPQDIG